MSLPRFSLANVFLVIAAIALWFSTIRMDTGGYYIRIIVPIFVMAHAIWGAIFCRGESRHFWIGFLVVMSLSIASENQLLGRLVLEWHNIGRIVHDTFMNVSNLLWLQDTCWLIGNVTFAVVGGYLCQRFARRQSNERAT